MSLRRSTGNKPKPASTYTAADDSSNDDEVCAASSMAPARSNKKARTSPVKPKVAPKKEETPEPPRPAPLPLTGGLARLPLEIVIMILQETDPSAVCCFFASCRFLYVFTHANQVVIFRALYQDLFYKKRLSVHPLYSPKLPAKGDKFTPEMLVQPQLPVNCVNSWFDQYRMMAMRFRPSSKHCFQCFQDGAVALSTWNLRLCAHCMAKNFVNKSSALYAYSLSAKDIVMLERYETRTSVGVGRGKMVSFYSGFQLHQLAVQKNPNFTTPRARRAEQARNAAGRHLEVETALLLHAGVQYDESNSAWSTVFPDSWLSWELNKYVKGTSIQKSKAGMRSRGRHGGGAVASSSTPSRPAKKESSDWDEEDAEYAESAGEESSASSSSTRKTFSRSRDNRPTVKRPLSEILEDVVSYVKNDIQKKKQGSGKSTSGKAGSPKKSIYLPAPARLFPKDFDLVPTDSMVEAMRTLKETAGIKEVCVGRYPSSSTPEAAVRAAQKWLCTEDEDDLDEAVRLLTEASGKATDAARPARMHFDSSEKDAAIRAELQALYAKDAEFKSDILPVEVHIVENLSARIAYGSSLSAAKGIVASFEKHYKAAKSTAKVPVRGELAILQIKSRLKDKASKDLFNEVETGYRTLVRIDLWNLPNYSHLGMYYVSARARAGVGQGSLLREDYITHLMQSKLRAAPLTALDRVGVGKETEDIEQGVATIVVALEKSIAAESRAKFLNDRLAKLDESTAVSDESDLKSQGSKDAYSLMVNGLLTMTNKDIVGIVVTERLERICEELGPNKRAIKKHFSDTIGTAKAQYLSMVRDGEDSFVLDLPLEDALRRHLLKANERFERRLAVLKRVVEAVPGLSGEINVERIRSGDDFHHYSYYANARDYTLARAYPVLEAHAAARGLSPQRARMDTKSSLYRAVLTSTFSMRKKRLETVCRRHERSTPMTARYCLGNTAKTLIMLSRAARKWLNCLPTRDAADAEKPAITFEDVEAELEMICKEIVEGHISPTGLERTTKTMLGGGGYMGRRDCLSTCYCGECSIRDAKLKPSTYLTDTEDEEDKPEDDWQTRVGSHSRMDED